MKLGPFSRFSLIFAAAGFAPGLAAAQDVDVFMKEAPRLYTGVSFEILDLADFDSDGSLQIFGETTGNVVLRAGLVAHRFVAVEAEYGFSGSNSSEDGIADYGGRFAGFIRPRIPIMSGGKSTGFEVFARAGFHTTEITSNSIGGTQDQGGGAYGFGAAYAFLEGNALQIRAEWTRYEYEESRGSNGLSAGLIYQF